MSYLIIIPARSASVRLPGKPLLDIEGKPMVVRTAEQAARSQASRIIIASDNTEICTAARQYGFESMLTSSNHPTGTDRLAEVSRQLRLDPEQLVINVQGDEPLVNPANIDAIAQLLLEQPAAAIATCAAPIHDARLLFNPNSVKVVCDYRGYALYFSRAPIPWARDTLADGKQRLAPGLPALLHIGLYAYRARFLNDFPQLPAGILEQFEALEQLRALENGYQIAVHITDEVPQPGVDTHDDLVRVRKAYANRL